MIMNWVTFVMSQQQHLQGLEQPAWLLSVAGAHASMSCVDFAGPCLSFVACKADERVVWVKQVHASLAD